MSVTSLNAFERAEIARYWQWHKTGRSGLFPSVVGKEFMVHITTDCSAPVECKKLCTYKYTRESKHTIDVDLGLRAIEQSYKLGYRKIVFTGGGEPLEPASQSAFFTLLEAAKRYGFLTMLITNGMFLSPEIFPRLFPYLDFLRVSMNGDSHFWEIYGHIVKSKNYCLENNLNVGIGASFLITPATRHDDILKYYETLIGYIDYVDFKMAHLKKTREGSFDLNVKAYEKSIQFIRGLRFSNALASERSILLGRKNIQYPFCYYCDFQLIVQADGKVSFCCEHAYDPEYEKGDLNKQSAVEILENRKPQEIGEKCFRGCAGETFNRIAHEIVEALT
jgi:MoaA/NifB/PqqE/SkfB family radical SAM enzyme